MTIPSTPVTVAAQREDLLRQVVFNRAERVSSDQPLLFNAEVRSAIHAFTAALYAEALVGLDPVRADEVARNVARYLAGGALPIYAWVRAEALGHDPQVWSDAFDAEAQSFTRVVAAPDETSRLLAEQVRNQAVEVTRLREQLAVCVGRPAVDGDAPGVRRVWEAWEDEGASTLHGTEAAAQAGAVRIWSESQPGTPAGTAGWQESPFGLELIVGGEQTCVYVTLRPVDAENTLTQAQPTA